MRRKRRSESPYHYLVAGLRLAGWKLRRLPPGSSRTGVIRRAFRFGTSAIGVAEPRAIVAGFGGCDGGKEEFVVHFGISAINRLRDPGGVPSSEAAHVALMFANFAWNESVGLGGRNRFSPAQTGCHRSRFRNG
jgi:hypothetical protein